MSSWTRAFLSNGWLGILLALVVMSLTGCETIQSGVNIVRAGISSARDDISIPFLNMGLEAPEDASTLVVHQGDTLYKISQNYRVDLRALIDLNGLQPPYALRVGQKLKLPAPKTYRVAANDTLSSIARLFDIDQYRLVRLNNLRPPYLIHQGQTLRLPSLTKAKRPSPMLTPKPQPSGLANIPIPKAKPATRSAPPTQTASRAPVSPRSSPQKTAPMVVGQPTFTSPLQGSILSSFGPKSSGRHNDGINIAGKKGAPVRAAESGEVVYIGDDLGSFGNLVLVRHNGTWTTAYAHLDSMMVERGDRIRQGDVIGRVGDSGIVDRPQLHFEIRKNNTPIDPAKHL